MATSPSITTNRDDTRRGPSRPQQSGKTATEAAPAATDRRAHADPLRIDWSMEDPCGIVGFEADEMRSRRCWAELRCEGTHPAQGTGKTMQYDTRPDGRLLLELSDNSATRSHEARLVQNALRSVTEGSRC
jgi:hypothetical protein